MKKVLIFKMGNMAYSSMRVFADELGKELQKIGVEVEYFDSQKESLETLEALAGKSYSAVIDFNSKLPGVEIEGVGYLLDEIDAPFFNYILDHPIYHHASLERMLKNYHIISVDKDHTEYVKCHYPHVRSVHTLPLGAVRAESGVLSKQYEILFPATFLNPDEYYEMIKQLPQMMREPVIDIIEILKSDTSCSYETAAMQVYERENLPMEFRVFAQSNFLADIYIRAYFREKVLEAVAKSGQPLAVCGEKYNESSITEYSNVTIIPEVNYKESLELIARSEFVLNVMPWFKAGIHDRVLNSMINGAVSITDSSRMLEGYFTDGKDYAGYSLERITEIPEVIANIVSDKNRQSEIIRNAEEKAEKMTFKRHVEILVH
ncbi:MAG: glycosyltransferase family 1 protein [Lachnospira sp.]|nr:glycosyltransferase family 1 protein [Lachnospira sp.]